jgi:nucleoid DNA-binding protein
MNHTDRIAATARQNRHLSRRLVKEAVETYLDLLAEALAQDEWVELHSIGKLQIGIEAGRGATDLSQHRRLRTKMRLEKPFKRRCYKR